MARAWLVCLAVLCVLRACPQDLLFDRITTADGLPYEEVHALFEDKDGYIWAGTVDGLARLEGTRIRVFHHDHNDSTTLAHDQVNGIAQDAGGTLWFATMDGLSRFDAQRGTFINRRIAARGSDARQANRLRQVLALGDTLLWLVTEAGLYRYDIAHATFHALEGLPPGAGPAGHIHESAALWWDPARGTMWAATRRGLASWDARSGRWTDHRNAMREPWVSTDETNTPVVRGDSLWFFRNDPYTLYAFDLGREVLHAQPDVEARPNLFTLRCQAFDPEGRHWISTWTHRLFQRTPGSHWQEVLANRSEPGGIGSPRVSALLRTRSGERWFGTDKGISILRAGSASLTLLPAPVPPYEVNVLRNAGPDTLLVGSSGGGVHLMDLRDGTGTTLSLSYPGEEERVRELSDRINAITPLHDGRYAVCTSFGIAELDPSARLFRPARTLMERMKGSEDDAFTFVAEDGDVQWLGTWRSGLWRCTVGGVCERVDTVEGPYGKLPVPMMLCWLLDKQGRRWLGMNDGGGLALFEHGRFRSITDVHGAHVGGVVRCMAEDAEGRIWLGTNEEGIVVYDPSSGTTRHLTRRDGLPGVCILGLRFTRDGTLWAITRQGIARMPAGTGTFRTFSLPSGIRGRGATGAMEELPDGRIAFGVGSRILIHTPVDPVASAVPDPVITGYRVNDEPGMGPLPAMELAAGRKALTLELGAVGGFGQGRPLFRYRVLPKDEEWHEIGPAQRIDLFDLSPGTHTIEVEAGMDGSAWSRTTARAIVEVLPYFYATWWFRALIGAVSVGALLLVFRLYLRDRLRKQREAFEREQAVLAERMRIAGDMHDDLGAGLSALKLRSEMALRVEKDPVKREQLASLASTAGELIGSMRQIIWTMNADQSSIEDLVSYTTHYARTYCEQNGLVPEIITVKEWPAFRLSSEQRRNIFLVVKEALHNVVKHANARTVRLVLGWSEGLLVDVQDDGVGLPAHTQHSVGNGLRNMRKRIETLGGTIGMERGMGLPGDLTGTRIRFSVPVEVSASNKGSIGPRDTAADLRPR